MRVCAAASVCGVLLTAEEAVRGPLLKKNQHSSALTHQVGRVGTPFLETYLDKGTLSFLVQSDMVIFMENFGKK